MIIENEITFTQKDHHDTISSWFLKLIITISTIFLIGLVLYYHYYEICLYCVNNSVEHWRVGLTSRKMILITLEIVICAIHPIPLRFPYDQYSENERNPINSTGIDRNTLTPISLTYVPTDVLLGLPSKCIIMFIIILQNK